MAKNHLTSLLLLSASLAACQANPESEPPPGPEPDPGHPLEARAVYVRASLDVRGTRPTSDELVELESDPARLEEMLDALVDDPRFAVRVATVFADALRTRRDQHVVFRVDQYPGQSESDEAAFDHAIAEEPVHLFEYVAANDRPLSEVVTADYTIVDPILLEVWPLAAVDPQPQGLPAGTIMARYNDGRPSAGAITTNSFMWRYLSTIENAQRGRANAVSRIFLCADYLDRPIEFPEDVDLTDTQSIHDAIRENQACQGCHSTMDPLASHLWGFVAKGDDPITWASYHPEHTDYWKATTEVPPGYFGTPTGGYADSLGAAIAKDNRFATCAARRVYESLLGRPVTLADQGQLALHREALVGAGLSLKALVRSVLDDPAYRGAAVESELGGTPAPVPLKLLPPELMASSLSDLSDYRMEFHGRSVLRLDQALRAVAGGSERGAATDASAGHALVLRRLAEATARSLSEGAHPDSRVGALLAESDLSKPPSSQVISALYLEIRSRRVEPEGAEIRALGDLWSAVRTQTNDPTEAWTALFTALFAHPTMETY